MLSKLLMIVIELQSHKNIVFDENGFEIEHFNEKLCANTHTRFSQNYNSKTELEANKI